MTEFGDGHSHAHAHGASLGGHDHGHHRANEEPHAPVLDVSLGDGKGAEGRRYAAAVMAETNLAEAKANQRKLKRATVFVLVFFVVEIIGGVWSGSLAIISDAAHLLADVSGFILAMVANEIASRPACDKLTYGPVRAEVLSALFSTVTILALSLFLVVEAIIRIIAFSRGEGSDIDGKMMSFIALLGLLVNLALLGIFGHEHGGHDHSHGHGHSHDDHDDHGDHDDEGHDHGHDGHGDRDHSHGAGVNSLRDEEHGVSASLSSGRNGNGVDERSSLVSSSRAAGALAPPSPNTLDISGSSDASSVADAAAAGESRGGGSIQYGSLLFGDGDEEEATLVPSGVAEFPDVSVVGAEAAGGNLEGKPVRIKKEKKTKNINMEAAVLHAVTDLLQSAGVLLAGLLIWYDPRWKWADPIATIFFVGLVVNSTRWLLQRACNVLLEGVPDSIDYDQLRHRLSEIEGVTDLHCLHVWSLTLGRTVVSAHLKAGDPEKALASAHEICEDMGVAHSTIQVQVDHCLPASCTHPCVSAVGRCCGPEGIAASPRSTSYNAPSPQAASHHAQLIASVEAS